MSQSDLDKRMGTGSWEQGCAVGLEKILIGKKENPLTVLPDGPDETAIVPLKAIRDGCQMRMQK